MTLSIVIYSVSHFFSCSFFFFFNDTATTEIYTLSLHDALPISRSFGIRHKFELKIGAEVARSVFRSRVPRDRKSTRLNSSHVEISYAVFCLKKKKKKKDRKITQKIRKT